MDTIRKSDIEEWKAKVGKQIASGQYSPHTANDWLGTLRVIFKSAVGDLELPRNPMTDVEDFDTSTFTTYTEEEPNSLTTEEVPLFLSEMRRQFPQFFALVALGFSTGHRPSMLRPLRRKGPSADLEWTTGTLLTRQSHTRGEVMPTTKTKRHLKITLPPVMLEILRWHVENLPEGPMQQSDLLFPSETGGMRGDSSLDKPFATVTASLGSKKRITPRAMRRTFQDLARAAQVNEVVTRAVSGHATEAMQRHYSTVQQHEIQAGLAKVISLGRFKDALGRSAPPEGASGVPGGVPEQEGKKPLEGATSNGSGLHVNSGAGDGT